MAGQPDEARGKAGHPREGSGEPLYWTSDSRTLGVGVAGALGLRPRNPPQPPAFSPPKGIDAERAHGPAGRTYMTLKNTDMLGRMKLLGPAALVAAALAAGGAAQAQTTTITTDTPSVSTERQTTIRTDDAAAVEKRKTVTEHSDGSVTKKTTTTKVDEPDTTTRTTIEAR